MAQRKDNLAAMSLRVILPAEWHSPPYDFLYNKSLPSAP